MQTLCFSYLQYLLRSHGHGFDDFTIEARLPLWSLFKVFQQILARFPTRKLLLLSIITQHKMTTDSLWNLSIPLQDSHGRKS